MLRTLLSGQMVLQELALGEANRWLTFSGPCLSFPSLDSPSFSFSGFSTLSGPSSEQLLQAKLICSCSRGPTKKNQAFTAKNVVSSEMQEGVEIKISREARVRGFIATSSQTIHSPSPQTICSPSPQTIRSPALFHTIFTSVAPHITSFLSCQTSTHHKSKHFPSQIGLYKAFPNSMMSFLLYNPSVCIPPSKPSELRLAFKLLLN